MRKMSKTKTNQEADEIDNTLTQIDKLLAQLPSDYQRDYAIELCDRFEIHLKEENDERKDRRRAYRQILNNWSVYTINGKPRTIGDYKKAAKDRFQWMYNK